MGKKIFLWIGITAVSIPFIAGCGKSDIRPKLSDPGYKAKLIFQDSFDEGLENWFFEGQGKAVLRPDSSLGLEAVSDTSGAVLWSRRDFSGNFQLEYEIFFLDTAGTHSVFFCAEDLDGKELRGDWISKSNSFNDYIRNLIQSYQITCHCYDRNGKPVSGSRLRKNPGSLLLAGSPTDPCKDNRMYVIDIIKVGNRIQFFSDGVLVHDVRDRGGFGPVYMKGQIGFYIQGKAGAFSAVLDNVRLFKLSPK
jgi:hypothetical protein